MKKIIFCLIFFCFFMLNWQTEPVAQQQPHSQATPPSTLNEGITGPQVAALFYRLSDGTPDFDTWARLSDAYIQAKPYDQSVVHDELMVKYREIFYNTFPDQMIHVVSKGDLKHYSPKQEQLFFPNLTPETYFSYEAFGEKFALLPAGIERFHSLPLTAQAFDDLRREKVSETLRLEFTLKPLKAEASAPLPINDDLFWAISTDIAEFRVWNEERTVLIYSYRADWHKTDDTLLHLYKKQ